MINTKSALKQQIMSSIDSDYLMGLGDYNNGFDGVSSLEMMNYLYKNHGNIEYVDLFANKNRLTKPFDPTQSIFNIINRYNYISTLTTNGG